MILDAALIQQCADPSLKPAIVEQFIQSAGTTDPLAVTVKSGSRLVLVPRPQNADEALALIRDNVGRAVIRVGLTQFPAGVGVKNAIEIKADLLDPCENLRRGTRMFAKVLRIVAKWYGNPKSEEVFPQIFNDAVYAWKSGEFEGVGVFQAEDPSGAAPNQTELSKVDAGNSHDAVGPHDAPPPDESRPGSAGIRVDLSRIGGTQ